MRTTANPFTDPAQVHGPLYATADRLARRTSALHRARVSGHHAAEVITDLAVEIIGTRPALVADIGCGRGTTTSLLIERLPQARVLPVDFSTALLAATRKRLADPKRVQAIRVDFHHLPLSAARCNLIVAAFCLYHSVSPTDVIEEMARCLAPGGTAIIAVKSADSYRELDHLVAASGLDPAAEDRMSLYQAAHTGNIESLVASTLSIRQLIHETHRFVFPTLTNAAEYLATSPKYDLPQSLSGDPAALAEALRQRLPDDPIEMTSVVTYLVATNPAPGPRP
jgi:ubiquinone/menaquinone biosynthesis C-methylase UbiE